MNITLLFETELIGYGVGKVSPLNTRFPVDKISPHKLSFEIIWLESVLGVKMLKDMIDKMNPLPSNYNPNAGALEMKFPAYPNYETLFKDYILPYVGTAFTFYYLPHAKVEIGAAGAQTYEAKDSIPATAEDMKALGQSLNIAANKLKDRLINFLCENKANYPLFDDKKCPCGCIDGENQKSKPPMFSSISGKINY